MKTTLLLLSILCLTACQSTNTTPVTLGDTQRLGMTDSDNDGIIDRLDYCPNTPFGISVDHRGCQML